MPALEPAILTIFGLTGDLAQRKLLPALYQLAHDKLLPDSFKIVGISRRDTTVEDVIERIRHGIEARGGTCDEETLAWLREAISIVHMNMTDEHEYAGLKRELDRIEDELGICLNRLFYLAIPSTLFGSVIRRLGQQDLNAGCQHGRAESRLLIEKPFGYDLESAEELIGTIAESFTESQVYRIDHYLAKETVQNILTFRFQNPLLKQSWDGRHISRITITASESIGIEGRAAFYEQMGALRDLVQSHLLQLLALIAMDKPTTMTAKAIHASKEILLRQVKPPHADQMAERAIRGQYKSYREEVGNDDSMVETFAAVRLTIENERWADVPVLIRTGKALKAKTTEITVAFYDPTVSELENYLTLYIQPDEGFTLKLHIKKPGFENETQSVDMRFKYDETVNAAHPDAYERVLVDAVRGDKTLFATSEEVLASWHIIEPIMQAWAQNLSPLHIYDNGSWGPDASQQLAEAAGDGW
jgi:glucose-6-phosphate 1-dehydrogenase